MNLFERIKRLPSDLSGFGRGNKKPLLALLAALCFLAGGFALPHALGFYYQLKGARIIAGVMQATSSNNPEAIPCDALPRHSVRQLARVQRAIWALHESIRYNRNLSHSYLLLGRGHCLLGDYENAIANYRKFVSLRPENPLGRLELGFAYSVLNRKTRALSVWKKANIGIKDASSVSAWLGMIGEYDYAIQWHRKDARSRGLPFDDSLIDRGGIFVLDDFNKVGFWKPCTWCNNAQGDYSATNGVMEIFCKIQGRGCNFGIFVRPHYPVLDAGKIILKAKGDLNGIFSVEIVVDGVRTRPIASREIRNDWVEYEIPIQGKFLDEIMINYVAYISKNAPEIRRLWIDWIALQN